MVHHGLWFIKLNVSRGVELEDRNKMNNKLLIDIVCAHNLISDIGLIHIAYYIARWHAIITRSYACFISDYVYVDLRVLVFCKT